MSAPPTFAAKSVSAARRALAAAFRNEGIESPDLDARILTGHALGLDHAALAAIDRMLTEPEAAALAEFARRRLAHEPVARIIGEKEFWALRLKVTGDVLVPRPDTETVVEAALEAIDHAGTRTAAWRIADVGTGSGALLIALLHELPGATGIGSDRSTAALAVARDNARRHGVAHRATFVACDYAGALAPGFDLVVANPPYIATDEIAGLAPDVRDYDPRLALDGGADGLDAYRALAADLKQVLRSGGAVACEVGFGQAKSVENVFAKSGLAIGPQRHDLNGVARVVNARNP